MPRPRSSRESGSLPYFSAAPPRIFAHRGFAVAAPENTIAAFAAALDLGARYLETDVHASLDGVAVVSHDPDLSRLTGRPSRVGELTIEQLRAIDLGGGETFCSLADALARFPEARFNIDVKSADSVGPTVRAVIEQRAHDRVLITSFSERRRAAAVSALPGVATSASASRFAAALLAAKLGIRPIVARVLRDVDAVQIPERAAGIRLDTRRMVETFHAAGVEVHFWTINNAAVMERLLDLHADGLVTDRTDLAVAVLEARAG